jgi:hypothetical protein
MGADMVIYTYEIPQEEPQEKALNVEKLKILLRLNQLTEDHAEDIEQWWEDELGGGGPTAEIGEQKAVLKHIVDEFFSCLGYRDVASFTHKGDVIFVTGGMSWGEEPTDSAVKFWKFTALTDMLDRLEKETSV